MIWSSPLSIYLHCYARRLNLAWESSLFLVPKSKNALGTIQSLYNFAGESAKRVAFLKVIEVEGELLYLSIKSLTEARWACRYKAMRVVDEQLKQIMKMLAFSGLQNYSDATASLDSRCRLSAICTVNFGFCLYVSSFVLSNIKHYLHVFRKSWLLFLTPEKMKTWQFRH